MQRLIGGGAFFDEYLHERAGFRRGFPRQAALTSGQPDRDIADPLGLAGFQDHILRQVVAFVEQAQRRHPVFHRGAIFAFGHRARNGLPSGFLGHFGGAGIGPAIALAGGQSQRRQQQERKRAHQASGDQAS